jgi:hypothetical protein
VTYTTKGEISPTIHCVNTLTVFVGATFEIE